MAGGCRPRILYLSGTTSPIPRPAAQRELVRMDRSDAKRMIRALEAFGADGRGDIKALKGPVKGR